MKKVMIALGFVSCIVVGLFILLTVNGRSVREKELEQGLKLAMESSLEVLRTKQPYEIKDADEFLADFLEALSVHLNSDGVFTVNILGLDYEKGLLSVEVIENYTHPNGKPGVISCVKTVLLESEGEQK